MTDGLMHARREMDIERARKLREAGERRAAALRAYPQLGGREEKIAAAARDCLEQVKSGALSREEGLARMRAGIAAVNEAYDRLSGALGFDADAFEPQWDCPLCRDTGYIEDADGTRRVCGCLLRRAAKLSLDAAFPLPDASHAFEYFDETVFPDAPDPVPGERHSQRALMRAVRGALVRYADALPEAELFNVVLCGPAGVGKTFLLDCVANRAAVRGLSVCGLTAYRLSGVMRRAFLGDEAAQAQEDALTACDLLAIDDLGSEPLRRNINIESMFSILNERCVAKKSTLVATNLTRTQIRDRYGERIASRLFGEGSQTLRLYGRDVRREAARKPGADESEL